MAGPKIAYRTATLEQVLPVPRSVAWEAIGSVAAGRGDIALGEPPVVVDEVVLSDEPPWRRVVRLDGGHPSPLCQTTITVRDDGDTCLFAWSCLIDPTGVEAGRLDGRVDALTADGSAQLLELVGAFDDLP